MADDFGDKTEAPTPRRRAEAREQGKVARSKDIATAALIIGSMMLMKNCGAGVVGMLRSLVEDMLGPQSMSETAASGALNASARAVVNMGLSLAPVLIGIMLIVVVADVLQVGLVLNGKR